MADFRRGGDALHEAVKNSGSAFSKTHFFSLGDGEEAYLRYLTDYKDWITVDQHANVPTKNKPEGVENWPASLPAVCRNDVAFKDDGFADCYVCEFMKEVKTTFGGFANKKSPRGWAIACLREPVIGTEQMVAAGEITPDKIGVRLGCRDVLREVAVIGEDGKPTGDTKDERALVVVNMGGNNYFNPLNVTASHYGSACDRDWLVKRTGSGTDTEYTHIPMDLPADPAARLAPGTEGWKRYEVAIEEQGLELTALVASRANDEYYGRFFDTRVTVETGKSTAVKPEVAEAPASEPDSEQLAAMRERIRGQARPASMSEVN